MIWLLWKISQFLLYKDSFPINMRQNQCHIKAKLTLIPCWSQENKIFKGKYLHFYLQKITFFMYLFCLLVFVLLLHRYCIKHLQLSMFEKFLAKVHKFNSLSLTAFLLHLNIFTWTFEFQFLLMWTCKTYFVMKGSFQLFLSVLFSINY